MRENDRSEIGFVPETEWIVNRVVSTLISFHLMYFIFISKKKKMFLTRRNGSEAASFAHKISIFKLNALGCLNEEVLLDL